MSYTVTALKLGRRYSRRFGGLVDAFDTALTLRTSGAKDIVVHDDAGRTYEHSDLCRLFGLRDHDPLVGDPARKAGRAEERLPADRELAA